MTFHFSFITKLKETALSEVEKAHAPSEVKLLVKTAIEGLALSMESRHPQSIALAPYLFSVEAQGHICDDGKSYHVSTAKIEVKPIAYIE